MAAPAQLEIDLNSVILIRSDVQRFVERVGGYDKQGNKMGVLKRGGEFWMGEFTFSRMNARQTTGKRGVQGSAYLDSVLLQIQDSTTTFKVPMPRQDKGVLVQVFDSTNTKIATPTTGYTVQSDCRITHSLNHRIMLLPGARFTVNNELFVCKATAGIQTISTTRPDTIPEFPTSLAGQTDVELVEPFAVGFVDPESTLTSTRSGSWAGPNTIKWLQE